MYKFLNEDGGRVRPRWDCAKDADTHMRDVWNAVVRPEDHVWHLGDVTMARTPAQQSDFIRFIQSLNGHKRLILGNHDHFPMHVYASAGFEKIKSSHQHAGLVYSHIPLHPMSLSKKVLANVHGHTHAAPAYPGRYINVCVEHTNYQPVPLDDVLAIAHELKERE